MTIPKHQVIRGGRVQFSDKSILQAADILLQGDTIADVGPPGLTAPDEAFIIDAQKKILIPGLVNAHTHSHYNFGKGLGDRWTLEMHLNAGSGIIANQKIDDLYLSTLLGAIEMVRKGCTSCYDMVVQLPSPTIDGISAIGKAYETVGMRASIAFSIADQLFWQSIPGLVSAIPSELRDYVSRIAATPHETTIQACDKILDCWPFDRERIRPALAPAIPMVCSDEFLIRVSQLARHYCVGLHTHLSESKVQALVAKQRYGKSLVQHLDDLGFLGPDLTAAHAIWIDQLDIRRLSDLGVMIAHNPGSNLRLGNGIAPLLDMMEAGLTVGIGTDACTCSDHLNMFEAMRMAALTARACTVDFERWPTSADIFAMATSESAKLLALPKIGRIAPGCKADIVFLDSGDLNYVPLNNFLTQLVFCESGSAVDSVMIGGHMVLDRGRFTTVDVVKIASDVQRAVDRLQAVNSTRRAELEAISSIVGKFCVGLARESAGFSRYVGGANADTNPQRAH